MRILGGMGRESDCKQAGASKEMVLGAWQEQLVTPTSCCEALDLVRKGQYF